MVTAAPSATAAAPVATPTPAATVAATFTPDWPAGQNGWTVQLQTLPKDGTTPEAVATAKADATTQGAADVGALDSDEFASLDGGHYVIYSGVETTKKDAEDALADLQANFPDAKVVEVGDKAADTAPVTKSKADLEQQEQSQSPEEAQKNTRKAPPTVEVRGHAAARGREGARRRLRRHGDRLMRALRRQYVQPSPRRCPRAAGARSATTSCSPAASGSSGSSPSCSSTSAASRTRWRSATTSASTCSRAAPHGCRRSTPSSARSSGSPASTAAARPAHVRIATRCTRAARSSARSARTP